MRLFRPTAAAPATALVLVSLLIQTGCAPLAQTASEGPVPRAEDRRPVGEPSRTERPGEAGKALTAAGPSGDAGGKPVPGLPRHPDSVRTGYSEKVSDGLVLIRASYLSRKGPDAVRGFYRGVFRAHDWELANVEYLGEGWHFLVLSGEREAAIDVRPRGGGSEVEVRLSRPAGEAQESWASAGGSKR